ncbi:MAG: hypothetical protein MUE53_07880 [Chitinophagales bacterium]|nr:hypothetical protein [Chitinophagales bacterium]
MNNKFLQTLLLSIVSSLSLHAQLSGNISIPGNYPSLQAAIVALNTQGVGGVGVTFDISAGHVEFLTQKIVITTTGTVSRPIVIRKNGIGANPVFFSYSGTSAGIGATSDGFIVIDGGDYITIDGLHFEESAINNDATKAMEYGILLCKKSTSDGAKFNTIQNCTFNLKNYNQTAAALGESWYRGSVGIAMVNSLATFNASLNVTAASGSNSFNHFYNNEISGAHCGISIIGFAPASGFSSLPLVNTFFGDIANHIGTSNTTGNLIRNFGGNSSESSAIYASQQWGLDIKYNTIENNDGNFVDHLGTMHGIYCRDAQGASVTISHNNITLTSSSNINPLTSIRNTFGSNPTDANIVAIDSNVLVNSSALNAISGFVYRGIWSNASPNTLKIWDNEISGFLYNTSNNTAIQSIVEIGSTPSYVSMQNNIISDIEIPTTGTFNAVVFQANNNIDSIDFINNTIANLIKTPNTNGALMHMYYNPSASLGGKQNIIQNNIQNIENGNGGFYGFRLNSNIQQTSILKNNTLLNVTSNALSDVSYGVFLDAAASGSEISENTITNFNSKASIYGIYTDTNVDSILMRRNVLTNIYSDVVNNNSNVAGIRVSGLKSLLEGNNISEIYNMGLNSNALVSGILVDGLSQGYLINNQVVQIKNLSGNLANAIAGIRVNAANSLSILHNTIYPSGGSSLNSSGTLFGGAALYLPSTTQANVSNNIFNISGVSKSTGFFASIGLTSTGTNGTAPSNLTLSHNILYSNDYLYAEGISTSNATNLFYSTSNSVFGKSAIGNDDAGFNSNCSSSFIDFFNGSALQNFIENNLVNSASGFSPSGLSFAESSAKKDISPIVNKDIAQNSRGLNADRGALEFSGTALDFGLPQIQITPKDNIVCLNALTIHAKITDNVSVNTSTAKPRLYYKRESDLNQIPVTNTKANDGWKYIEASGIAPNFVFLLDTSKFSAHLNAGEKIQYFVMAQDNNSSPNVSSSASFASNFCPSSVVLTNSAMPVSAFNEFIYLGNPNSEFTATQNPACQNSLDTISVINFVLDSSNRIGTQNLVSSVVSPVISSVSFGRKSQFIITSNELKAAGLVSGALTGITL